jgi:phage-related minor tail protein
MDNLAILTHEEAVWLNHDILSEMYKGLGKARAEDVVLRAAEELSVRLSAVETAYFQQDRGRLLKATKSIVGVAEQIGMTLLARVARDVVACGQASDEAGLGATLARMMRIGDQSLAAIWDPHHLTV